MQRPKKHSWIDDEIDGLAAHRRFLEGQGFAVEQAAHGDDALALLRRQPYSVVLLDEQMPGRRGLDLIPEIRSIDPAMPVVMVTHSEDDGLLREAIGIQVTTTSSSCAPAADPVRGDPPASRATASASSAWRATS